MEPTVDLEPELQPQPPKRQRVVVLQPGHLSPGWGNLFWTGWLLIGGGFGAIWYSSRVTGLSTWWLGPQTEPRIWFHPLPFLAPFTLSFLALRITRHLPWYGMAGSVAAAAIAVGDLADQPRYAAIEFALAAAGLAISVASLAGLLRADKGAAT